MSKKRAGKGKNLKPFMEGVLEFDGRGAFHLTAGRCGRCGSRFFPKRIFCPACGSGSVRAIRIKGKGKVYTYTVCRVGPPGIKTPYAIGYVDVKGVRVFGRFEGWEKTPLRIGREVELIPFFEESRDSGEKLVSYRFEVKDG
ncbi:MAG: OB-fold domain-containing protein [bacterium]